MNHSSKLKQFLFCTTIFFSIIIFPVEAGKKILKIGAIPDQNQEMLDRRFNLFARELSKKIGIKAKYVPVTNYIAAVSGFRTNDLDLVWFGGLSGVQARLQSKNAVVIAQRDIDKEFKSIFILNKKIKLRKARQLKDLQNLKNLRFTFGSENSTSGRLMPEYFLNKAGLGIKDFHNGRVGFSGSHDSTIALVNSGSYDAGALNKNIWDKVSENNPMRTKNIYVFYVSPEYVDYHWLVQGDLDKKFRKGLTKELEEWILNLDRKTKTEKEILDLFNANKFIQADASQYKKIESIGRKLKKIR